MDRSAKDHARSKRKLTQRHNSKHSRGGKRGGKGKAKDVKSTGEAHVGHAPPPQVTAIEVEVREQLSAEQIKYGKRDLGSNHHRFQGLEEEEGSSGADMRALLMQEDVEEESASGAYFQLLGSGSAAAAAAAAAPVGLNASALALSLQCLHGRERLLLGPCSAALAEALEKNEELKAKACSGAARGSDAGSREARLLEELCQDVRTTDGGVKGGEEQEVNKEEGEGASAGGEDDDDLEDWLDSVL